MAPREVHELADLVTHNEDSIVSRALLNTGAGSMTLFAFAEGQQLSEHTAPFDAFVQVIEGTAEIVIDKVAHTVEAGQVILMPANVPHAVNARQRFTMVLTMFKDSASIRR
jgi:quercetin dioxygenase-like cupin family protein